MYTMETITFKLTRTELFDDLRPYGNYTIKFKTRQQHLPNIIPYTEVRFNYDTTMPVDDELDKKIIKFMKKHKTDVFIDSRGDFYTRIGRGFGKITHRKLLVEYKKD